MVESKFVTFFRLNQKGQAAIEYVLLLVITISMVLLAIANLFKPMQNFMKDYMGTYVSCLLSSGELPAIRTENTMKDTEPKCSFSMAKGTAQFGGTGGRTGGSGSNSNDPNGNGNGSGGSSGDSNGAKNGSNNSASGDSDGSGNGSGRGSYAGSRSRASGFGRSAFKRNSDGRGSGEDDMAGGGGKRYINGLDRNKNDRFFQNQSQRLDRGGRRTRGIALSGMTVEEQKKIERKIQTEPRALPKPSEEFSVPSKKTVLKPPPLKTQATVEEKSEGFTLGNLLRYVLIAVVILLILILGGGQVFEMSKTMD